ncbi:MAG: LptF/LptG family permease, partial [Marinovum sp.]|nr:LptF/LptG family permease [Marinovum sp.]
MMLHFYFGQRFSTTLVAVFGMFFCFLAMLDLIEQLRRFGRDVAFQDVLWLSLLNAPSALYTMLPLIVILAAILLFMSLSRSSELIVARASGRSAVYSLMAPVLVAFTLGIFAVAICNPIVATTSKRSQELRETYRNNGVS